LIFFSLNRGSASIIRPFLNFQALELSAARDLLPWNCRQIATISDPNSRPSHCLVRPGLRGVAFAQSVVTGVGFRKRMCAEAKSGLPGLYFGLTRSPRRSLRRRRLNRCGRTALIFFTTRTV
jgi:hypothetical protein